MVRLIPSILSDKLDDYKKFASIYSEFSEEMHLDYMDGIYVEGKSPDIEDILNLNELHNSKMNIHIMSSDPRKLLEVISKYSNIELVYIHADVFELEFLDHDYSFKLAVALNPGHSVDDYKDLILSVDAVLVLTIIPGGQGHDFLPQNLVKIEEIRAKGFGGEIHIDGHVNKDTVSEILEHKPDALIVGSAIQHAWNPKGAFEEIKSKLVL